jgi:uncharacterized membrane protein
MEYLSQVDFMHVCIVLISATGFFISFYIFFKKKTNNPLVCPMHGSCTTVIHSDYSRIVGMPVEHIGLTYYSLTAFVHAILFLRPLLETSLVSIILVVVSTLAFLFSLYLIIVQGLVLRNWCTWCIMSAFISSAVFAGTIYIVQAVTPTLFHFLL